MSRLAAALVLAVLVAAAGCAARPPSSAGDVAAIEAGSREYERLVRRMDHDSIAAMFVADGELANPGAPPLRGRDSIRARLRSFAGFHVEDDRMTSDSIRVVGDRAAQFGSYWQRVRIPGGQTVEVSGRYQFDWVRSPEGVWQLQRIATVPAPR